MVPRRIVALIAFLLVAGAPAAQAGVILTAVESGGDVVISGEGTLNTGAWSTFFELTDPSILNPTRRIIVGPTPAVPSNRYGQPDNFMGDLAFGTEGDAFASSGSGDLIGLTFLAGDRQLYVPDGYVSGDPLSGSATWAGETFASLGMEIGQYEWTWGSGSTADSFTLNVVPEPSTAALMTLGLVGLAARRRRA